MQHGTFACFTRQFDELGRSERNTAAHRNINTGLTQLLNENRRFLIRQGKKDAIRIQRLYLADKRAEITRTRLHGFQQQHFTTCIFNGLGRCLTGKDTPVVLGVGNNDLVGTQLFLNGIGVIQGQDIVGVVLAELIRALLAEVGMRRRGADLRNFRFGENRRRSQGRRGRPRTNGQHHVRLIHNLAGHGCRFLRRIAVVFNNEVNRVAFNAPLRFNLIQIQLNGVFETRTVFSKRT